MSINNKSPESYRVFQGSCPDEECKATLYFPHYDKSIECTGCGQRHDRLALKDIAEVTNPKVAIHNIVKNVLLGNVKPKKGADDVKVLGLSNYVCKLISPILTYYGMDKKSGKAKLLSEMGKGEIFDVSILGDRAFVIEEENLKVTGYGLDRTGSMQYLAETLEEIDTFNDNQRVLVPIHADGDGHCLVHAISRALVGRELFWHALRINLKTHMVDNLDKYKELFREFVDKDEWETIVDECDPYYVPPEGEALGLRNIHIFGLANVLHRPIILLDSKSGLTSLGDYSGVFLPGLIAPEQCKGKDGTLNKPLCIAWSSQGRNHYIPLVVVKGKGPARLPYHMVKNSWGMPKESVKEYIEFDKMYRCVVGGDKCLTDKYVKQLVSTMEEVFMSKNDVNPNLVADMHQYIYKSSGIVGMHPDQVIERTKEIVRQNMLYRCLTCEALMEYILDLSLFETGGLLYTSALKTHKRLDPTKIYSFPTYGAVCMYDERNDCLVVDPKKSKPEKCAFCTGDQLRLVRADGSVVYHDGDRTATPCVGGKCPCGFKHYWGGKEYDNLPGIIPITLSWGGKSITEKIAWFQDETDPMLNSNVYEVATNLVQRHFPGEFGSERLVQQVVDTILAQSATFMKHDDISGESASAATGSDDTWAADTASKIILTGHKKKTLHKEELTRSATERQVRANIQKHATKSQARKTDALTTNKHNTATHPLPNHKPSIDKEGEKKLDAPSSAVKRSLVEPQLAPGEKRVRLQTSDGRQVMLTLVKDVTFEELQKLIFEAIDVPADRQKIRIGFPPKLLQPMSDSEQQEIVPLNHGDKIALEVLPDKYAQQQGVRGMDNSWGSFEEDAHSQNAERLLQTLKEAQHGGDSIDASIASLGILGAVAGKDMWTYVQPMPHLFSVGGLLYNQVKRDLGLVDGKHCQLPCLPGKVFRYSAQEDRLELCLEPYGHFPVEPNIEQKVMESGMRGSKDEVKFGASGVISHGTERQVFRGQGHSLKNVRTAEERMPVDLECAKHTPHVRGIQDLCHTPGSSSDTIVEEQEDMITDDTGAPERTYRLGPGYTVLDQSASNNTNTNLEMFKALSEQIERTLTENMTEDDDEDTNQSCLQTPPTLIVTVSDTNTESNNSTKQTKHTETLDKAQGMDIDKNPGGESGALQMDNKQVEMDSAIKGADDDEEVIMVSENTDSDKTLVTCEVVTDENVTAYTGDTKAEVEVLDDTTDDGEEGCRSKSETTGTDT